MSDSSSKRGQTTIDFAVGVSVFLLAVIFIFSFVPSLFAPFDSDQSLLTASDRIADTLTQDMLVTEQDGAAQRYVLERDCTTTYFERVNGNLESVPSQCRYPDSVKNVTTSVGFKSGPVGVGQTKDVNVTIESYSAGGDTTIATVDGTRLATGDVPPTQSQTIIVSEREVVIEGTNEEFRFVVRVW